MTRRVVGLAAWCFVAWLALAWTVTVESVVVGVVVSLLVATPLARMGPVVPPWRLLSPRRFVAIARLAGTAGWQVVRANVQLAARIWNPRLPVAPGMVIVQTLVSSDGELAAVGIITSLIVDNQIVDLDRSRHELLYHCIAVMPPAARYEAINGPIERRVTAVVGHDG